MDDRLIGAVVAVLASAGMLFLGLDVEALSALLAVLWRTEDLIATPEWLSWVVYVGLVMVAAYEIEQAIAARRS